MQIEKNRLEYWYSWVVKNKKHLRGSTQAKILPLAIILTAALGEYRGPHTASSVFLFFFFFNKEKNKNKNHNHSKIIKKDMLGVMHLLIVLFILLLDCKRCQPRSLKKI